MAQQIVVCDGDLTVSNNGTVRCTNWVSANYESSIDSTQNLADAINNHATVINSVFDIDPVTVAFVSGSLLVLFIKGNVAGKIAHLMRKS